MVPDTGNKKVMLKFLEQLYDDVETDKAIITSMMVENGHQEVTRTGSNWLQYIPTGHQTISLEIERRV